jgi:hypothetical protein
MTVGPSPDANRVCRGGSWLNEPRNLRAAYRNRNWSRNRNDNLGFRVLLCRFPEHARPRDYARRPCREVRDRAAPRRPSESAQPGHSSKPARRWARRPTVWSGIFS